VVVAAREESLESRFRESFRDLLRKVIDETILPGLNPLAYYRTLGKVAKLPEAKLIHDLAVSSSALAPLTWDAAGKPIRDLGMWVNGIFLPAIQRYEELMVPGPAGRYPSARSRLSRVAAEVIAWAAVDPVTVKTTTLVHGIRSKDVSRFKVTDDTVLRLSTDEEWGTVQAVEPLIPQPLCLETTEQLPRLESPSLTIPTSFIQSLHLLANAPITLGDTRARATVPTFGMTPYGGFGQVGAPIPRFPTVVMVSGAELRAARRMASAFADLADSGFDLALDLYVSYLHGRGRPRDQAVNISIALENLYLAGIRNELTYRFQLHVLRFGRYLAKAEHLSMREARDVYNARSTVVHGAWGPNHSDEVMKAIELLRTDGARLVQSTLLRIASPRHRQLLLEIGSAAEKATAG
jgi:hypothetical protein